MGITISTLDYSEEVKARLFDLKSVMIEENRGRHYTLFKIDLKDSRLQNRLNKTLANKIADIILEDLEAGIINKMIKSKYSQYTPKEREKIEQFTHKHLSKRDKLVARLEIIRQLLKYLEQNKNLNIEGFVRFRLQDYIQQLKLAVEKAVEDILLEKEYTEFLDLLKYFVNLQDPRIPLVNVIKKDDDSFLILDEKQKRVNNEYLEGYLGELMEGEVEYEDLLISALINISPARIILHFKDPAVEEIIRSIFEDRVEVCKGCSLCFDKD